MRESEWIEADNEPIPYDLTPQAWLAYPGTTEQH